MESTIYMHIIGVDVCYSQRLRKLFIHIGANEKDLYFLYNSLT